MTTGEQLEASSMLSVSIGDTFALRLGGELVQFEVYGFLGSDITQVLRAPADAHNMTGRTLDAFPTPFVVHALASR